MQGQGDYDKWAHNLQRWGVSEIVAAFIEGAGVLSILLAQFLYFSRPFWGRQQDSAKIAEIAEMLDNNEERKKFAKLIREMK